VAARLREDGANVHRVEDRVMPRSVNVVETLGRYIGTFLIGLMGVDDPMSELDRTREERRS
jgi:hypothetical protein